MLTDVGLPEMSTAAALLLGEDGIGDAGQIRARRGHHGTGRDEARSMPALEQSLASGDDGAAPLGLRLLR